MTEIRRQLIIRDALGRLLTYPSEYRGFNRAYEQAQQCLSRDVPELYVVQYRSANGELFFSFVGASLITPSGPYFLKDVAGIVERAA
jgi:hypothetical protein